MSGRYCAINSPLGPRILAPTANLVVSSLRNTDRQCRFRYRDANNFNSYSRREHSKDWHHFTRCTVVVKRVLLLENVVPNQLQCILSFESCFVVVLVWYWAMYPNPSRLPHCYCGNELVSLHCQWNKPMQNASTTSPENNQTKRAYNTPVHMLWAISCAIPAIRILLYVG